jgi:competence protein ComEA
LAQCRCRLVVNIDSIDSLPVTRRQLLVLGAGLLAVLALVGMRLGGEGRTARQRQAAPLAPVAGASVSVRRLVVDVVGAVRKPGLYRVPDGARIADAVARAGGPTRRADMALINLAAPLVDGMQVVVPTRVPVTGGTAATAPGAGAPASKVSLSSATVDQLDSLPGIGPVTAQKIVDWRTAHGPFASVDALDEVPGIGPARLEQLRDLVTP